MGANIRFYFDIYTFLDKVLLKIMIFSGLKIGILLFDGYPHRFGCIQYWILVVSGLLSCEFLAFSAAVAIGEWKTKSGEWRAEIGVGIGHLS